MKAYQKYKLVNTNTGERIHSVVYTLSLKEVNTINYAYGLNGVSKRMVLAE
jgi:hypothetical protein